MISRRLCRILAVLSLIVGMLALMLVPLMIVYGPQITRCMTYRNIVYHDDFIKNLEPRPSPLPIHRAEPSVPVALGYGEVALPIEWLRGIETKLAAITFRGRDNETVTFMPLTFETGYSPDGNYSWAVRATHSVPVTTAGIFTMPAPEYRELMLYTMPKVVDRFNQNGIGLFETEHVRGIVRYGMAKQPGKVNIEVWSKQGKVSQGILIRTQNAESASRLIQCVLSDLRYSINSIPAKNVLLQSIQETLEKHPAFDPRANGKMAEHGPVTPKAERKKPQ